MRRFCGIICLCVFAWGCWGRAPVALFFATEESFWCGNVEARGRLEELFKARGVELAYAADAQAYLEVEQAKSPEWIIWGPCETVPESLTATVRAQLLSGARLLTAGGMPFWYEVDADGKVLSADGRAGERAAGISGAFVDSPGSWTAAGKALLAPEEGEVGGSRGINAVRIADGRLVPLASAGGNLLIGMCVYPGDGRFFFGGTAPLHGGELNILTPEGVADWEALLDFLAQPLPAAVLTVPEEVIESQDETARLQILWRNPVDRNLNLRWRPVLREESGFRPGDTRYEYVGEWREEELQAELAVDVDLPLDEVPWGVMQVGVELASGIRQETALHVLPPVAAEYLDVHPLFAPDGTERTLAAGVYGFVDGFAGIARLERREGADWKGLAELEFNSKRGILPLEFPAVALRAGEVLRFSVCTRDRRVIHDTEIGIQAKSAALERDTAIFRALDGIQFAREKEFIFDDLTQLRERTPLLRGLQPGRLAPGVREWMRDHDFLLNYGAMLNDMGKIGAWRLDDANAAGVSAVGLMPGHSEDPALWLVRQNSRSRFAPLLAEDCDIVNLIEAVPGYETPGMFSAAERGGEDVAHFFGYASRGVRRQREALAGIDGGIRLLTRGGKDFERFGFAEIYAMIYGEALPEPTTFGWSSWQEYEPFAMNLAQQHGWLTAEETLRFRLHWLLRTYFQLKRLDDLSGWLHADAPEVHNVAHEGPLIGQMAALTYRLPYVDTNTLWLFRSAWRQGWNATVGAVRYWYDYSRLFGHRFGLHEEIGGGQWAPYRTAQTSFVSVFSKRGSVPFDDLQVDFYLGRDRTYRVAEETAMFRGFQLAVDTGAELAEPPRVGVLESSDIALPELKRGVVRRERAEQMVTWSGILKADSVPNRSLASPLQEGLFDDLEVIVQASEHPMAGDFAALNAWLRARPGRTLILNHAGSWNLDYTRGFGPAEFRWEARNQPLAELGLAMTAPFTGRWRGLPVLSTLPPAGARTLLADDDGNALVWEMPVGASKVIYSGFPIGNLWKHEDTQELIRAFWAPFWRPYAGRVSWSPSDWFVGVYRLQSGRYALAAIRPEEAAVADRDYGVDGDAVEAASAAIGGAPIKITLRGWGAPHTRWQVIDAWQDQVVVESLTATADGSLEIEIKTDAIAKLYWLQEVAK